MPFAIELLFDAKTDAKVRAWGRRLEKAGAKTIFSTHGASPHVALSVFESYDKRRLPSLLRRLGKRFPKIELRLSSLGSFPGKEGVLFFAPVPSEALLRLHSLVHQGSRGLARGSWEYYKPGWWVPHCTLCMHLPRKALAKGFSLVQKANFGMTGRFTRVALVEVIPGSKDPIRPILSVPLTGKGR